MANKRLSELNELQAIEIQPDDLTLTTDVSVLESKKLRFQTLKNWVLSDPSSITASYAYTADSASYLIYTPGRENGTASYAISSSYALSASWADTAGRALIVDTASYIDGDNVDGGVTNAINAETASYLWYNGSRPNGTASYALTASYVENAVTSSYIWYTGIPNGTASYALNCESSGAVSSETASYLWYNGSRPNGTASLALKAEQVDSASYLIYNAVRPNGTASFSISSSYASRSYVASQSYFLHYNGNYNGTASYAMRSGYSDLSGVSGYATIALSASWASQSLSSSYAISASTSVSSSYALTASYCGGSSSHARFADYVIDTNVYRIWGPYKSTDVGGLNTVTEQYAQNFIISPSTIAGNTVIIMALFDVKCPITTTDTDTAKVELYLEYTEPSNTWSFGPLDTTRPNNYINLVLAVSGAISGYNRTAATLGHDWPNVSGSWWRLVVRASGGALLDTTRGTTFFLYTKSDTTVTKTAYPPF
jgi:hypothetical protein